jgi:hypothetical protein
MKELRKAGAKKAEAKKSADKANLQQTASHKQSLFIELDKMAAGYDSDVMFSKTYHESDRDDFEGRDFDDEMDFDADDGEIASGMDFLYTLEQLKALT